MGGDRGRRHLCREEVSGGQVYVNNRRAQSLSGSLPTLSFFRLLLLGGHLTCSLMMPPRL